MTDPATLQAIAGRLRLLRVGLKKTGAQMAEDLGVSPHTWYVWERAQQRIKAESAMQLVEKFGVTLPWIYYGIEPGQRGHVFDAETWNAINEAKQREKV